MKIAVIRTCLIIFSLIMCNTTFAQLTAKPTFESCGLYYTYTVNVANKVYYKTSAESEWLPAYSMVFDSLKNEFRGSLVRLKENTDYDVKLELYNKGQLFRTVSGNFKTWTSEPVISQTLNISSFSGSSYVVDNLQGTADGWIKITGNADVNRLSTTDDAGIKISNCKYVILEGITLIGGGKHGFSVVSTSSNIRIVNCDISKWGHASSTTTSKGEYIDSNGNIMNNEAGVCIDRASNIVVERCYIHDSKAQANAWKGTIKTGPYAGNTFSDVHPKGPNSIFVNYGKEGIVLRNNDCIGSQTHRFNDVIESAQNGAVDGGFGTNADIYGNMLAYSQDDVLELDGAQNNARCFNNRMEQTFCGISVTPNLAGPSYIFNNVIWNLGDEFGNPSVAVKNGGGLAYTKGRQFFFNNTMYTTRNCISGVGYGSTPKTALFLATTRNNILVSGRTPSAARPEGSPSGSSGGDGLSISDREKNPASDFDYDMLGNTVTATGTGVIFATEGQEAHGIYAMPQLQDPDHGVFTLKYKDTGIDKGLVIPNFSDKYHGLAPDMGAFEMCASSLIPIRPLDIIADKYYIKLTPGSGAQKITLYASENAPSMPFTIRKSEDMQWLTVTANAASFTPNAEIELTLTATSEQTGYKKIGTFIVRLQNGLSVPVTVLAE